MIPTSQIRDLRDAAERVQRASSLAAVVSPTQQAIDEAADAWCAFKYAVCDPTTVKALCTELLAAKAVFQNRANLVQAGDRLIIEFRTSGEAFAAYELISKMERST